MPVNPTPGAGHGEADREAFEALLREAYARRDAGRPFLDEAERAVAHALEAGDEERLCRASQARAEALHASGDTLTALQEAERAIAHGRTHAAAHAGRSNALARALLNLAILHDAISGFEDATRALLEALPLLEGGDDDSLLASVYNSLGVVRSRAGDHEAGLTYYGRAIALRERIGDRHGTLQLLNNRGINLKNLGRFDESLEANEAALALATELDDAVGQVTVLANRGILLAATGDAEGALAAFARAEEQALPLAADHLLGEIARRRAELHLSMGALDAAAQQLSTALAIARRSSSRALEQACLALRSEVAEAHGDLRQALDDLRAAHALERELREASDAERLRRMTLGHELAMLRQESADERRRNADLARAYAELERLHQQLAQQANLLEERSRTDALTGVANRAHLDERLRDEVRRVERYGGSVAVAMIDVDHFKRINDGFSHAVGDQVLRALAAILRDLTRDTDLVARYGGEEFALVLPEEGTSGAAAVCAKLLDAVRTYPWGALREGLHAVTISAGVAASDEPSGPRRLLRRADERLYRAKREGRARVVSVD